MSLVPVLSFIFVQLVLNSSTDLFNFVVAIVCFGILHCLRYDAVVVSTVGGGL